MGEASFGKYRLIAELGHGGMADVFLAVQAGPSGSGFRKLTVVKRLRQNLAEEPEFVAMLVDEARIAARLNHPNVVQTNEVGQVGSQYFIAMEYLDGQPLHRIQHRAAQRAKKGEDRLITKEMQFVILMDVLAGLHHAHELCDYDGTPLSIVHRDTTPHNIFVTYAGQVKVVDFGIAKAAGRASETRQGVVKGKVRYMAPEQAIGQQVDRRVDVFAVGVMLWEAVVGRRMWKDMDDLEIVQRLVAGDAPASPRAVDPSVPEELDAICRKALARRPEDRYETAEDFRTALEQYLVETRMIVEARRKLVPALAELFADKRSEIKHIIEKQLAALEEKMSSEMESLPRAGDSLASASFASSGSFSQPRGTSSSISSENAQSVSTSFTDATAGARPTAGVRLVRRALVGAAAVGLGVIVALAVPWGKKSAATTTAKANEESRDENTEIHVHVSATPSTAKVTIDDLAPGPVPFDVQRPRDEDEETQHRVLVEADGYVPRVEFVRFTTDLSMTVDLKKGERPAAAAASSPTRRPTPPVAVVTIVKPHPSPPKSAEPAPAPSPPPASHPPPTLPDKKPVRELDKGDPWK